MAAPRRPKIHEHDLQGFKHFKLLLPILDELHGAGCGRDRAGNRRLHFDQYVALILLYFFNPIVQSLRGIQQASELAKVQRLLRCPRASLGSLSEAARVFDAQLLRGVIGDLVGRLKPLSSDRSVQEAKRMVTLVDSTLLRALPKITEAMWRDEKNRAFKLHTHFEVLKGVPVRTDLTSAKADDRDVLARTLQPGRTYVLDRGYQEYRLFAQIIQAGSSFVCRIRDNSVFELIYSRALSAEARAARIVRDDLVRFSGESARRAGFASASNGLRVVEIQCTPHRRRGAKGGQPQGETILIATDMLDVPAEVIALLYRHRWAVEIFFRFFKHVLGCRHLLSHCTNGIEIQTYVAIIACLLIALWTGRKPTLRTYEMICFYFTGLADQDELLAHVKRLHPVA
jgi:hypothetical protein